MEMELLENGAIRCVVGQSDLDRHNITMLDFVIHPESSRSMLQEFIELAFRRYGFCPASNTLIEAVPLSKDRMILTFSNGQPPFFSDFPHDAEPSDPCEDEDEDTDPEGSRQDESGAAMPEELSAASPLGLRRGAQKRSRFTPREASEFRNTRLLMNCNDILGSGPAAEQPSAAAEVSEEVVICFRKLDNLMSFADIAAPMRLSSTLFYGAIDRCYVLLLNREDSDPADLRRAGDLADEYGTRLFDYSIPYYREYFRCIAEDDALEKLRSVR